MKCKCGKEMYLEESDYDNYYIKQEEWSCECGNAARGTSWGTGGVWEYDWYI